MVSITSSQQDAVFCTGGKGVMNTYALQSESQSQREGKSTQQPGQNIQHLSREGNRQKQERKKERELNEGRDYCTGCEEDSMKGFMQGVLAESS